jgi:hypothetical protein
MSNPGESGRNAEARPPFWPALSAEVARKGIPRKTLAEAAGVSEALLTVWLSKYPPQEKIEQLAAALDVPVALLQPEGSQ